MVRIGGQVVIHVSLTASNVVNVVVLDETVVIDALLLPIAVVGS